MFEKRPRQNLRALSDGERITRRAYLMRKMMMEGVQSFQVAEAISTVALDHPDWDMDEIKTWTEWEKQSA